MGGGCVVGFCGVAGGAAGLCFNLRYVKTHKNNMGDVHKCL